MLRFARSIPMALENLLQLSFTNIVYAKIPSARKNIGAGLESKT